MLYKIVQFLSDHGVYCLIPFALFFEVRYLMSPARKEFIAMRGWFSAERIEQPVGYWFLWLVHVCVSVIFAAIFLGYVMFHLWPKITAK